ARHLPDRTMRRPGGARHLLFDARWLAVDAWHRPGDGRHPPGSACHPPDSGWHPPGSAWHPRPADEQDFADNVQHLPGDTCCLPFPRLNLASTSTSVERWIGILVFLYGRGNEEMLLISRRVLQRGWFLRRVTLSLGIGVCLSLI